MCPHSLLQVTLNSPDRSTLQASLGTLASESAQAGPADDFWLPAGDTLVYTAHLNSTQLPPEHTAFLKVRFSKWPQVHR